MLITWLRAELASVALYLQPGVVANQDGMDDSTTYASCMLWWHRICSPAYCSLQDSLLRPRMACEDCDNKHFSSPPPPFPFCTNLPSLPKLCLWLRESSESSRASRLYDRHPAWAPYGNKRRAVDRLGERPLTHSHTHTQHCKSTATRRSNIRLDYRNVSALQPDDQFPVQHAFINVKPR